jgi:CRISPR-associated exonuclease Cas4
MLPIILILVALLLWLLAHRARRATGLPEGEVVYTDTGGWGRLEKPLFSPRLRLTGKPDYLVREGTGFVPVEVKSGRAPAGGAYAAHIYQLAAYCVLTEEAYGPRPAYGLIKYADKILRVEFTSAVEAELLDLLDHIRADAETEAVARSHSSPARCRACGFREVCEESLA